MTTSATRHDPTERVGELLHALSDPLTRDDPYPTYAALRALGPALTAPDGAAVVTGYRGVGAVAREPRLRKNPARVLEAAGFSDWEQRPSLAMMFGSILFLNPPDHTRLRGLVSAVFTPRRVAALAPAVDAIVAGFLDALDTGETVDFVDAFAFPLPVTVIGELLGIPAADRPRFQQLVHDWAGVLELLSPLAVDTADVAATAIADYLDELASDRQAAPRDDLVSALVEAEGDGLTRAELVSLVALLLAAGFETTTGLLGNGLLAILEAPDQLAWLQAHPEASATATEELLRFDSPTQVQFGRAATEDVEIGPVRLHAGQRVVSLLGSANRDPEVFDQPDRLRLGRAGPSSVSFGGGIHHCVGAPLARLETAAALRGLVTRFGRVELAGPPVRRTTLALRGLAQLPISVG
ncbi:cytochrome P450 [Jatrophihabitans sp. YIM 134969]